MSIHVRIQNTWLPAKVADKNTQAVRYFLIAFYCRNLKAISKPWLFFFSFLKPGLSG